MKDAEQDGNDKPNKQADGRPRGKPQQAVRLADRQRSALIDDPLSRSHLSLFVIDGILLPGSRRLE